MSKFKIIITLLIIVVVLATVWFFAQRRHPEKIEKKISIEENIVSS